MGGCMGLFKTSQFGHEGQKSKGPKTGSRKSWNTYFLGSAVQREVRFPRRKTHTSKRGPRIGMTVCEPSEDFLCHKS